MQQPFTNSMKKASYNSVGQNQHMDSGAGDVEALNKILNNINVQTKKNDTDGKLPRKIYTILNYLCSDKKSLKVRYNY